jgi:periplasmic protein TonB
MADKGAQRRLATRIAGGIAAIALIAGFVWFVNVMMSSKGSKPPRLVQAVQIIRPPPPPPPEQPPPPPQKTQEPLPKELPEPTPEQPEPASERPLGIDADGTAGADAFGLAARHGGTDLIGTGTAPFAWYTNRMREAIKEQLTAAPCTKSAKGTVSTRVVVAADGHVKQIKLTTSTGNPRVDECVERVLASISSVGEVPPPGMPEQVNLRVVF